ncbi:hypothetical protein F5888DRAFT_1630525 [Russula emetica]|nr:hypothetical protein F5888DRAFT_1630525 [Russula emetica]
MFISLGLTTFVRSITDVDVKTMFTATKQRNHQEIDVHPFGVIAKFVAIQTAGVQNAASGRTRVRCRAVFTERAPSQPDCVNSVTFDSDTIHDGLTTAFAARNSESTVPAVGTSDTVLVYFNFVNREQHELDGRVYRDVEEEGESKLCTAQRGSVILFGITKKTELRDWVPATPRRIDGLIAARTEHGCAPR